MKLFPISWSPTDRQLRQFAGTGMLVLPLLGWFLCGASPRIAVAFAVTGILLGIAAWLRPRLLQPVFVGLSLIAFPIGMVISEVVLLFLYFGLFTPLAIVFRIRGRDALQRPFEKDASTYWRARKPAGEPNHYFRQF